MTTNLNITPARVGVVALFQRGLPASKLSRAFGISVPTVYSLTGDIRFVRAARKINRARVTIR